MPAFLMSIVAWFVRSVLVKFLIMFALFFVMSEFIPVLVKLLPSSTNLKDLFVLLPDSVWYFLNYFKVPTGITMVISALLTRFLIRRIPIIG
ncbi:DUF2523 domain-containing protein [Gilliamella sp. Occ3-1]|uniref:DUF2523 family protein n=1 Tax=Gilliamella sp. Occ3-1 TaxID=3120253 RepID=UPI00080E0436|nr:DUF2523 family protein [Gilliamella apicola]OCG70670.1 DUF2523 domain-containing protein [Gilliamella apicola]